MHERATDTAGDGHLSIVRRFLLWWFSWPVNPYVSANVAQDFTPALDYFDQLSDEPRRITVNHLLAGAVARTLLDYPEANARIRQGRIVRQEHVGMAMPVDLLRHGQARGQELALAIVERVDTLTLRQIAERTDRTVDQERKGMAGNAFIRIMSRVGEQAPGPVIDGALETMQRSMRHRQVASLFDRMLPVTTALTNPGATFRPGRGQLFRGGAIQIPERLVHVGTVWGVSAVQDEVVALDGQPAVRPMLPLLLVFDHRLVDGVKASRMLMRFGEILSDPAAEFGEQGHRPPQRQRHPASAR